MIQFTEVFQPSTIVMRRDDWNFVFGEVLSAGMDPESEQIYYTVVWGWPGNWIMTEALVSHWELIRVGHC